MANFPNEFGQPENSRVETIKKLGLETVKIADLNLDYRQKADIKQKIKELKKELYEQTKIKESIGNLFKKENENWKRTLYRIHRHTGISIKELKLMSVYDFYTYKQNTIEEIKKK